MATELNGTKVPEDYAKPLIPAVQNENKPLLEKQSVPITLVPLSSVALGKPDVPVIQTSLKV